MKTITIGRDAECQIVLSDPKISRRHALLRMYPTGKIEIVDISTNGTFVNGIKISKNKPVPVKRTDIISFAYAEKLNWKLVPNTFNVILWGIICSVGVILVIVLSILIYNMLKPERSILEMPNPTYGGSIQTSPSKGNSSDSSSQKDSIKVKSKKDFFKESNKKTKDSGKKVDGKNQSTNKDSDTKQNSNNQNSEDDQQKDAQSVL